MGNPLTRNQRLSERNCTEIPSDSLDRLQPGDHIFWKRTYKIEHHAIVVSVDPTIRRLQIIHNNKHGLGGTIELEYKDNVDNEDGKMYRVDYSNADQRREDVLQRAEELSNVENSYDLIFNNCEHFATNCATGISESPQIIHKASLFGSFVLRTVTGVCIPGALFGGIAGAALGYIEYDMLCAYLGRTGTLSKFSKCVKVVGTIAGASGGIFFWTSVPKVGAHRLSVTGTSYILVVINVTGPCCYVQVLEYDHHYKR